MAGRFGLKAIFSALDAFSAPVAKMQGNLERFTKSANAGLSRVDRMNGKIASGLQTAAVVAGTAGIAAGAGIMHVVTAGAEFEQAITNVGAVMGKSRGQIADLEKEAMRLGVVTQFSSTEVADAMEFMARKGFDSQEILGGIPGVLNAVAASGQGVEEVATVVGSSIRGFGLEADKAGRVADILAFAAEKTGATITDLGIALSTAAPTAKALGVSIADTTTAVGLMQKMGIDASTAGTAVATMLAKISKPSKDAATQMAAMGIKFKDAAGNMLPFRDVLGQFVKAGDKAGGNMNKMAFFAELVGLRGDKAALALSDMAKSGDFDKLADGIQNVSGYAEKVANLRLQTTTGSWKLLTSTIEVLETKLFNLKSGALKGVIDGVNAWIAANQDLIVQNVQDFIQKVADNLPAIWLWLKRIGFAIAVWGIFALAVKGAEMALWAFEAVMVVTSVAGSLLSGALGLLALLTDGETLSLMAATAWVWLKNAALVAYNAVVWLGVAAATVWNALTTEGTFAAMASAAWTWLQNAAVTAYNAVVGFGATVLAMWNAGTLLGAIRQGALTAVVWLAVAAQTALNLVMSINPMFLLGLAILGLIALVVKFSGAWDWLKGKIHAVWDAIAARIQPIIDKVTAFIDAVKNAGKAVGHFLGFGGGETTAGGGGEARIPADNSLPLMTPNDAVANMVQTTTTTTKAELTIRDQTGSAELTQKPQGNGFSISLNPSGSFAPATP
jgi:TP901 family phage tail tape measure protein